MKTSLHTSRPEMPLPRFVQELLASPPHRGSGLHQWLFRVARVLHPYCSRAEIIAMIGNAVAGEPVQSGEIEDAVDNSAGCAWQPSGSRMRVRLPRWPSVDANRRAAVLEAGHSLADLWETSPFPLTDNRARAEEFVDALFPSEALLCCGKSSRDFATKPRSEWRGSLSGLQLIVPSPMTEVWGKTKKGRRSQHTLSNTGPRRFLVIEQDSGTADEQAAVLLHLAEMAPLALAVHSGSKSIHGWFYCLGRPEERLRAFMNYAVSLGADRATWSRSQFVRMPDGTREGGARQAVYYFNPEVLK
jgi:hypothetical protein